MPVTNRIKGPRVAGRWTRLRRSVRLGSYQKAYGAWLVVPERKRGHKKATAVYKEATHDFATWVSVRIEQVRQAQQAKPGEG